LLSPSFIFIVIAIGAFVLSEQDIRTAHERANQQEFDKFVENVKSGKWQLTTDKWLDGLRVERSRTESERRFGIGAARVARSCAWYILLGVACQALVVFSVRANCKKP
jgi:hypothetical protein